MDCLVSGCNFFLKAIRHEAFTFESGQPNYIASNGALRPRDDPCYGDGAAEVHAHL